MKNLGKCSVIIRHCIDNNLKSLERDFRTVYKDRNGCYIKILDKKVYRDEGTFSDYTFNIQTISFLVKEKKLEEKKDDIKVVLLGMSDMIIDKCKSKEDVFIIHALQIMINNFSLEEPAKEISEALKSLYIYCQDQVRLGNYEVAIKVLEEIKDSFIMIFKNKQGGGF